MTNSDNKIDYDLEKLLSFVSDDEKYQEELQVAILNKLWEYSAILVWKIVILFCYEKLFQLSIINKVPQPILKNLSDNNRTCNNCFSFNSLKDDKIYENMQNIWSNLDVNFKNTFKSLLDERNSLSHVNEYNYSKIKFDAYLEKVLDFLDHIQDLHDNNFEELKNTTALQNSCIPYLSTQDVSRIFAKVQSEGHKILDKETLLFLIKNITNKNIPDDILQKIKESGIYIFWTSRSYDGAKENGDKIIIPLAKYFDKFEIKEILEKVFENGYNQILPVGGVENVFMELLNISVNIDESVVEYWLQFKEKLIEGGYQEKFADLIAEIDNSLVN